MMPTPLISAFLSESLKGICVLDFSTLLPGPLTTRMLAESGASIIKIEPPGGEEMRRFPPFLEDGTGACHAWLNAGKNIPFEREYPV